MHFQLKFPFYAVMFSTLLSCGHERISENSLPKIIGGCNFSDPLQADFCFDLPANHPAHNNSVAIKYNGKMHCSGFIVADNLIITAAHCMNDFTHVKSLVEVEFENIVSTTSSAKSRKIVDFKVHPDYVYFKSSNDIAWVKLDGNVPANYEPIKILENAELLTPGVKIDLVGYGVDALNNGKYGKKRMVSTYFDRYFADGYFSYDSKLPTGACRGDSGGPAYLNLDNQWYVIGSTVGTGYSVTGAIDCSAGKGVYTFIGFHKQWIEETSKIKLL